MLDKNGMPVTEVSPVPITYEDTEGEAKGQLLRSESNLHQQGSAVQIAGFTSD